MPWIIFIYLTYLFQIKIQWIQKCKKISWNISEKIMRNIKNGVWINMRDENGLVFEKGAVMYGWIILSCKILPRHKFLLKGLTNYDLEGFFTLFFSSYYIFFYDLRGCLSFIHNSVNDSIILCHRAFVRRKYECLFKMSTGKFAVENRFNLNC